MSCMRSCERSLFDAASSQRECSLDESWCVYLLPLTDCTAFKVGFSCNPLQRIYSFSHRYFERFDLHAALLLQLAACEQARAIETTLKLQLAEHRMEAPAWVPMTAGGHTEWFGAVHLAQAREILHAMQPLHEAARLLSPFDSLQAELMQRRTAFEAWACHLAQQLTAVRAARTGVNGTTLRDWLDAYHFFDIPLFADDPAARQFVMAVSRMSVG